MQAFPTLPALHAQLDAQVQLLTRMTRHAIDALGQLGTLNLRTARQLVDDGIRLGRQLGACNDPFQMTGVSVREAQPALEHWRRWQTEAMGVLASGGAAMAREANDGGWQAARASAGSATDPA